MGKQKLQFVWPKDGPQGKSGHRGFWGRLNNIMTNRGPDVFLQRKGSCTAIKPDFWGNWDSYHDQEYHEREESGPFVSRGFRRYDPQTRRYVSWVIPQDWHGHRVGPNNEPQYPHFSRDENRKMLRQLKRSGRVDPARMGQDWHDEGPKRFQYEHDWFWQEAHRAGENSRAGLHRTAGINPFFRMHQNSPEELDEWIQDELYLGRR